MLVKNKELLIPISFAFGINFYPLLLGLNSFVNSIISNTPLDSLLLYLIFIVLTMSAIILNINNFKFTTLLITFFFMIMIIFTILIYNIDFVFKSGFIVTILSLPFFFLGEKLDNKSIAFFYKYFNRISYFSLLLMLFYLFAQIKNGNSWQKDMTAAYSILPVSILSLIYLKFNFSMITFFKFIISVFLLFMFGTRGPFLLFLIFTFLFIFFSLPKKNRLPLTLFYLVIFLSFSGVFFLFLNYFNRFLINMDIYNVSLNQIINGTFLSNDSGRFDLIQKSLKFIFNNPFFGYGLYSDRFYLGTYAHNLLIELLFSFGLFIGSFTFLLMLVFILKKLFQIKNKITLSLYLFFIVAGFIKLFLSNSFLEEPYFFALLGLVRNTNFK